MTKMLFRSSYRSFLLWPLMFLFMVGGGFQNLLPISLLSSSSSSASIGGKGGGGILFASAEEEQVTWTPNEERKSLPMSMKQRQQLVQLHQTISSSPDPDATLAQVAQANEMSPQELANMLNQNMQDLQQNPDLLKPILGPQMIQKAFFSMCMVVVTWAKQHPSFATISGISILLLFYLILTVPRTGGVLSSGRGGLWFSRGPSTWLTPPTKYLTKRLTKMDDLLEQRSVSIQTKKTKWDDLVVPKPSNTVKQTKNVQIDNGDVTVVVHKLKRSDALVQAITAQVSIRPTEFLAVEEEEESGLTKPPPPPPPPTSDIVVGEKGKEGNEDEELDFIMDLLMEQATTTLSTRQLTEFVTDTKLPNLKFVPSPVGRQKFGILVVPKIGDFRRYGLVYWQSTSQSESELETTMTLSTLKKLSHWDGQIHVSIRKYRTQLIVQVHLVVPRKGRSTKINIKQGQKIVSSIAYSIATSTRRRTQQAVARQSQSNRFHGKAASRAIERRHQRHQKEMEIEEMAEDRRRRWQRTNQDSGRYRPSGKRQQSPNNC